MTTLPLACRLSCKRNASLTPSLVKGKGPFGSIHIGFCLCCVVVDFDVGYAVIDCGPKFNSDLRKGICTDANVGGGGEGEGVVAMVEAIDL